MTDKSRQGRRNRIRGQEHEREVEKSITDRGGHAEKSREYHRAKAWDICALLNGWELRIQCKRRKQISILTQAHESLSNQDTNVWCLKADRVGNYALLPWETFLDLLDSRIEQGT